MSTNYVQTALGSGVLHLMNLIEMAFCLGLPTCWAFNSMLAPKANTEKMQRKALGKCSTLLRERELICARCPELLASRVAGNAFAVGPTKAVSKGITLRYTEMKKTSGVTKDRC